MKTHNIRQAIEWAFKQGVEPIQSSTRFQSSTRLNPDSFHTELIEATLVATSDSVLQSVSDVLRQEPELTLFDNSLMCIGENVRQGPVTYESVACLLYTSPSPRD